MKLVRDFIPKIIEEDGRSCKWRTVFGEDEHITMLSAKMREEVDEFVDNPCYEEAADMVEVIKAFCYLNGLEWDIVLGWAVNKQETHGGFNNGLVLLGVE